jgi:hypothetical protein
VKPFFDEEFELDPGIAFHGTSHCSQSIIESEGLLPDRDVDLRPAVERVVRLFQYLGWCGITGASRAVLEPFTLNHDLQSPRGKPIYLAESSIRASRFATRDFAGGEGARGLRHSFEELRVYVEDHSLREEHLEKVTREFRVCQRPDPLRLAQEKLAQIDLDFVRAELEALADVERRVRRFDDEHAHGLVYAVRLPVAPQGFEYHRSMGLKCFVPLGPECILDKVVIPLDFEPPFGQDDCRLKKFLMWCDRFG